MNTVYLRDGREEAAVLVKATMASLSLLLKEKPIAFYELVMIARDPLHKPFGRSGEELRSLALLAQNGGMHDSVRAIVLCAVEGADLDMRLVSPLAESQEPSPLNRSENEAW